MVDGLRRAALGALVPHGPLSRTQLEALVETAKTQRFSDTEVLDLFDARHSNAVPVDDSARALLDAMRVQMARGVTGWSVVAPVPKALARAVELGVLQADRNATALDAGQLWTALGKGTSVSVSWRTLDHSGEWKVTASLLSSQQELEVLLPALEASGAMWAAHRDLENDPLGVGLWTAGESSLFRSALSALVSDLVVASKDAGRQLVLVNVGQSVESGAFSGLRGRLGFAEVSGREVAGLASMLESEMFGGPGQLAQRSAFVRWAQAHPEMLDAKGKALFEETKAQLNRLSAPARAQLEALVERSLRELFG